MADGGIGDDTLVALGTVVNDAFVIDASGVAGGRVDHDTRLSMHSDNIETLTIEGLAGDDSVILVPAISDGPYATINVNGGRNILISVWTAYDGIGLNAIEVLFAILDDFANDGELNGGLVLDDTTEFVDALLGVSEIDWLSYELGRDIVAGN